MAPPVLRIESAILRQKGQTLLGPLSLEVSVGERLCVLGPPASGKSLLLEVMAGRHVLSSGHRSYPAWTAWHADSALGIAPRFAIQLVSSEEQRRVASRVATFHQARWHSAFCDPDTVEAFLSEHRVFDLNEFEVPPPSLLSADYASRRRELLGEMGIEYVLERRVAALSNGELRKLLLARALLAKPRLLLLDDPLGGLDPAARRQVLQALIRSCEAQQTLESAASQPAAWREPGEPITLVVATPRPEEIQPLVRRTFELEATRAFVPDKTPLAKQPLKPAAPANDESARAHASHDRGPVLKLTRASVSAGATTILHDVTFEVRLGEHWLITGHNGSGKSTLLALLLGDHPQSYVANLEVLGLRAQPGVTRWERQRRIGFMAPELAMHYPPGWTVGDVVLSGLFSTIGRFAEVDAATETQAQFWLSQFDLATRTSVPFGNLTEAEQRRALLARALVRRPALLLLDEPTQGLTEVDRARIFHTLDTVTAGGDHTLLLVSHHPDERPRCITHYLDLEAGRVVSQGPIAAGRTHPPPRRRLSE
jgi:molybdate transport system ATP-binding protein